MYTYMWASKLDRAVAFFLLITFTQLQLAKPTYQVRIIHTIMIYKIFSHNIKITYIRLIQSYTFTLPTWKQHIYSHCIALCIITFKIFADHIGMKFFIYRLMPRE